MHPKEAKMWHEIVMFFAIFKRYKGTHTCESHQLW